MSLLNLAVRERFMERRLLTKSGLAFEEWNG